MYTHIYVVYIKEICVSGECVRDFHTTFQQRYAAKHVTYNIIYYVNINIIKHMFIKLIIWNKGWNYIDFISKSKSESLLLYTEVRLWFWIKATQNIITYLKAIPILGKLNTST